MGGLHFAGEYYSVEAQGAMERGYESGEPAAMAAHAQRGLALRAW